MAIYHLSAKVISRGAGKSVVAAAAYRSGDMLRDERYDKLHNYQRKQHIETSFIMAPDDAPEWVKNRETLGMR